jgi:hypothetical protein
MAVVDERSGDGTPQPQRPTRSAPGEAVPSGTRRLLDRAPGERYVRHDGDERTDDATNQAGGSQARAVISGLVAGAIGVAVIVALASPLALAEPLVIVAALAGIAIGLATRWGGGSVVPRSRSRRLAAAVAILAIVVAQLVIWQLALSEGGVLPLADYLFQTFGLVVPLEAVAIVIGAWATA